MTQLVARMDDELVVEIDRLIAQGVLASRSEAVRAGLSILVDQHRRRAVGARIVEGYERQPQTSEELAGLEQATAALVAEEPW
jgi:Arc/MetJ-type ribon-helix-helix transcriptional regulator